MHQNGFEFESNLKYYQQAARLLTSLASSKNEINYASAIEFVIMIFILMTLEMKSL